MTIQVFTGGYWSNSIWLKCGASNPDPIQKQSHIASLNFLSSGLAPREGFKLEYSADEEEGQF